MDNKKLLVAILLIIWAILIFVPAFAPVPIFYYYVLPFVFIISISIVKKKYR